MIGGALVMGGGDGQSPRAGDLTHVLLLSFSRVGLFVTPWTVARQAPLSMEFSRQDYWSGLPSPPPGNLPQHNFKAAVLRHSAFFLVQLSHLYITSGKTKALSWSAK